MEYLYSEGFYPLQIVLLYNKDNNIDTNDKDNLNEIRLTERDYLYLLNEV